MRELKATPVARWRQYHVLPSLIVGLGGSGQRVLDGLKKLFRERLGEESLPLVELLAIDVVPEHQRLAPGEFLQLQVRGLAHALERFPWSRELKEHRRIRRLPNLEQGCGGIPPIGRLAFAVNRDAVLRTLRNKLLKVSGRASRHRASVAGVEAPRRLELPVWLVVSFFGSTGSGMFLDLAALLRTLEVSTRVHAIVFLPSCFGHLPSGDYRRGQAVGYAMLRQLHHVLEGGEFVAVYEDGEERRFHGFLDQVYVVDGISEGGLTLDGDRDEHARLAAEFLFAYTFTDFGARLEAQLLNERLTHSGVAAFGIHKIVHPVDKLVQVEKLTRALKSLQRLLTGTTPASTPATDGRGPSVAVPGRPGLRAGAEAETETVRTMRELNEREPMR